MVSTPTPLAERAKAVSLKVRDAKLMEQPIFVRAMEVLVSKFAHEPALATALQEVRQGELRMEDLAQLMGGCRQSVGDLRARLGALKDQIEEKEVMVLVGTEAKNDAQRKAAVVVARKTDADLHALIDQRDELERVIRENDALLEGYGREWSMVDHKLRDRRALLRLVVGGED